MENKGEAMRNDLQEEKVSKDLAKDRNAWKSFIRNCSIHASMEMKHDDE